MTAGRTQSAHFVREAHAIVRDLLPPRLLRYWTDFLITVLVAYAAFAVYISAVWFSWVQGAAFLVCGLAMFRAVVFTHEITHRRTPSFGRFTFAWNVLCGIPFLMPSFMYGNHHSHHTSDAYGTWSDPEYLLHTPGWAVKVTGFLLLPIVYPVLIAVRFLIFAPLVFVSDRIDRFVWKYGSSLYVMNESYRREYEAAAAAPSRWMQEAACAGWAWMLCLFAVTGYIPWAGIGKAYLVFVFWISINQVRTLAAHRYTNAVNTPISHLEQLLDTNTFAHGRLLPELWAPVGLRYHALHHLLPLMPYHSMAEAHARLMRQLPSDSPYHSTVRPGLFAVLKSLLLDRDRPRAPLASAGDSPRSASGSMNV